MWQSLKNIYHFFQSFAADILYNYPSGKLKVIGVTGTDGKTTTSSLIYHILKTSGKKVSMISTVYAQIGGKTYDTGFHVTTPSPFTVRKYFKEAVNNGDEFFVLETTSHALDQYRVHGVTFEVGVITNITHEHLLYHKTYDNYVKAKTKLLKMSKIQIINRDDESYKHIIPLLHDTPNKKLYTYSLYQQADYQLDISNKIGIRLPEFNKYNYLAAYSAVKQCGLSDEEIFNAMKLFTLPPGRMEIIYREKFTVILDFAHTPNAIFEALKAVRTDYPTSRLIHIFGAASQRDDTKRPLMGEASGTFANLTIITEEDYRREDPVKIAREIARGLEKKNFHFIEAQGFGNTDKTYTILVDRGDAIKKAVQIAQEGDVIILTGKGHEKSLCRGTKEYPWDDRSAALDAIGRA